MSSLWPDKTFSIFLCNLYWTYSPGHHVANMNDKLVPASSSAFKAIAVLLKITVVSLGF